MKTRVTNIASLLFQRRKWAVLFLQSFLVLASLSAAWLLSPEFKWEGYYTFLWLGSLLVVCRLASLRWFGLHHGWWRYTGVNDAFDIIKAVSIGSLIFTGITLLSHFGRVPLPIYFLEAFFTAALLMGVRLLTRAFAESARGDWSTAKRILIIGAGFGAQMLLREIRCPGSGYIAVGCVDDDTSKFGLKTLGCEVLGAVDAIPALVRRLDVEEVLIAIPSASSSQMRRFVEICESTEVGFRTVPALRDFLLDQATLSQVREVNFEDLLGREPVQVDLDSLRKQIAGRVILITGAAGSIGSEICRQILTFDPATVVCLDQNETGMFYLQEELNKIKKSTALVLAVGDVQDAGSMRRLVRRHDVEIVFHAAAYKHVPMMECNVHEAVKNNVFGLITLLNEAKEGGCESFILISSDKAVNPTSIMGATKRISELIMASSHSNPMRCVSVRFGNVLGSSGSLIPILQEQIRKGQPITITHPEIRRFFMTTKEAVSLVLQAFAIGHHRDVLVLDMGSSLQILDIAKTLIRLSGKSQRQVPIVFTGLREGEKFFEELFYQSEQVLPTSFEKIKRTVGHIADWHDMQRLIRDLEQTVESGTTDQIRDCIKKIVPEYVYTPNVKTQDPGRAGAMTIAKASGL